LNDGTKTDVANPARLSFNWYDLVVETQSNPPVVQTGITLKRNTDQSFADALPGAEPSLVFVKRT
jgi:hypothetical protein